MKKKSGGKRQILKVSETYSTIANITPKAIKHTKPTEQPRQFNTQYQSQQNSKTHTFCCVKF